MRRALKEAFPSVKFSVRSDSYAGGASIRVEWLDGPTDDQVRAVTDRFASRDFDGMIDLASSRYHWLTSQGEIYLAEIQGTEGSRGTIARGEYIKPHDEAELVSLGSNYVFTRRNHSRPMLERAAAWAEKTWGERPEIREHSWKGEVTGYYLHADRPSDLYRYGSSCDTVADVANREAHQQAGPRHSKRFK